MASGGGKRKIGHNKKRSVSMQNYVATGRLLTNKKRRIAKEAKRQAACKLIRKTWPWRNDVSRALRQVEL